MIRDYLLLILTANLVSYFTKYIIPKTISANTIYNCYPSQKVLRKMGLLTDQDGIMMRYVHEKNNWQPHLTNTSRYIQDSIKPNTLKSIAVLGSGWLLDVPIDYLSKNFAEVTCYDIKHPKKIVSKYAHVDNLKFIEIDLTGGLIDEVYKLCSRWSRWKKELLKHIEVPQIILPNKHDIVISVNLLNQLDILIIEYIKKYYRFTTTELNTIRESIQQAHISFLKKHHWCLVTDFQELHIGTNEEEIGKLHLLHCELPQGKQKKEWVWHFDTRKTYNPKWRTYLNVVAISM